MDWSKGEGFLTLHKSNFFPLLKIAKEQTYTLQNIRSAWMGAELVLYNKYKIFSYLKAPSVSDIPDITQQ
jgi:hypothetical protein